LEHLYDLYAERHHLLWKADIALTWMRECAQKACQAADNPTEPATSDGLCAADFAAARAETFPASTTNAYAHLSAEDFSDVVKRQMPARPYISFPCSTTYMEPQRAPPLRHFKRSYV